MQDDLSTIIYLRTTEEFYNRETLRAFAERLAQLGHYVAGTDWNEVGQVWKAELNGENIQIGSLDPARVFTPAVSPILQQEIEAFVEERPARLEMTLFSTARTGDLVAFEGDISLEPEDHLISMSMLARQDTFAPFLHWLEILQATYETWHPLYAYKEGGVEETTHEDALANNVALLYEMNLLNPEMVEKLGRARVLSTPAWRVTELTDGSVFLIPQLIANGGTNEDYHFDRETAAAHLGLEIA